MDEIVRQALLKWPKVPHCHGWLALDARGDWYLRDQPVQAAGAFPDPKGSRIEHRGLREFIERNYEADASGGWFFQNGPQRVYVDLEAAPWIWRLHGAARVESHTGRAASVRGAWLDERGRLFLDCDIGFGLVHSLDMELAAQALQSAAWPLGETAFALMPQHFGYQLRPRPAAA